MSRKKVTLSITVLFALVYVTWVGRHYWLYKINIQRSESLPSCTPLIASKKRNYDILLVGYLRGGTTFTGRILGVRQGNFYIYEPLHSLNTWGYYKSGFTCSINEEYCVKSNGTDELVLDILRGLYTCDNNVLLRSLQMWQILKGRGYEGDLKNPSWMRYFPECHGEERGCVEKIVSQCANSTALVSKVPRVSLSMAAQLLNKVHSLKIIHLLRDPRAIMKSRDVLKWTPAPGGSLSLCRKMSDDYFQSDIIKKNYPGRLLTIFYEDLVTHPAETVRMMYDFAGYDFDEKEQNRLRDMTGMTQNNTPISSDTKTSLQVAMGWRTKINQTFLNAIDTGCKDVYKLFGYPALNSETDIRNSSTPLRIID